MPPVLALLLVAASPDLSISEPTLGLDYVWSPEGQTTTSLDGKLVCGPPYREEVEAALPRIRAVLSTYTKAELAQAHLQGIRFCRDLAWRFETPNRRVIDGATDIRSEQLVGGLAVTQEGRMYLDVANALRAPDIEAMLEHELFHFLDRAITSRELDQAWQAINPPGFRYVGHGMNAIDTSPLLPGEHPGFVSPYSRASMDEDRAELFTYWRTKTAALAAEVKKDAVLAAKAKLLLKALQAKLPTLAKRMPRL